METPEAQAQKAEENVLDVGNEILSWETWEFPPTERSRRWYILASVVGLFLLLYALFTANFVFGIIILMFAVITIMRDLKRPSRVPVYLTTSGLVFGNEYFRYEDIRDFSLSYEPPVVKNLYVTFHGRLRPMLSIDIEGHELVALSGFDFAFWRPRLVLIEDHVTHLKKHQLMTKNGYQLLLRTGLNSWYVPADTAYTFSMAARFEFVRKYYLGLPLRKWRYAR